MKIRIGFVSNSSSTSFCIYGCYIDEHEIKKIAELLSCSPHAYIIADQLGLEYHQAFEDGYSYVIGISPKNIKDDETGAQFKKRVQDKLKEIDPNIQCDIHEGGWYDG